MSFVDFITPALEHAKSAVSLDEEKRFADAFRSYMISAEYFLAAARHESNLKKKEMIEEKCKEVVSRMEKIREYLDNEDTKNRSSDPSSGVAMCSKKNEDSDDPDAKLKSLVMDGSILKERPNVHWDDIAGLEVAKDALYEAVIMPLRFPQFFTGKREPWRGILLYGPPGTGKSFLAKAVATEANATFFSISSSKIMSKWLGDSEKRVASLFEAARENAPSIIFVDEVDSLCSSRSSDDNEAAKRVKTEFLVQMDGVGSSQAGVLVLGATNLPYELDQGIRRRFERRIYIPLPDLLARVRMLTLNIGDTPHILSSEEINEIGRRTEGYSGSDMKVLVRSALFEPIRTLRLATHFKKVNITVEKTGEILQDMYVACSPGDSDGKEMSLMEVDPPKVYPTPVNMSDFEKALRTTHPSVSRSDLDQYERFTEEFGLES